MSMFPELNVRTNIRYSVYKDNQIYYNCSMRDSFINHYYTPMSLNMAQLAAAVEYINCLSAEG